MAASSEGRGNAIRRVRVGLPITVPDNYGDTWVTTWADDGYLYTPSNDTLGFRMPQFFNEEQVKLFSADGSTWAKQLTHDQKERFVRQFGTIALNRVQGHDPRHLRGTTVNRMREFVHQDEFGTIFDDPPIKPADGRYWKSSGCTFVDGALYWVIRRDKYPNSAEVKGLRQSATNASIIKSTDYGRSWTRSAKDNLESPVFPGDSFATPYFVDYGRSRPKIDGADRFVYAISNNGFWDNGDKLIIGRVRRDRLGYLDGADWEFLAHDDGSVDSSWDRDAARAKPILENPKRLGETGAVYLPSRGRYLLIGWYYPAGSGYLKGASNTTVWDLYDAPKPWGPWRLIDSHTWSPEGYYCPSACPKFQSADRIYVVTAGDFHNWWDHYHLTLVPIDLSG